MCGSFKCPKLYINWKLDSTRIWDKFKQRILKFSKLIDATWGFKFRKLKLKTCNLGIAGAVYHIWFSDYKSKSVYQWEIIKKWANMYEYQWKREK